MEWSFLLDLQARIDDAVYERLQRDVKYKDPLVWQYLRDKQNLIQEEAERRRCR